MAVKAKKVSVDKTLGDVPEIPRGRCYLVIGPDTWGKAFGVRQAWENASKPKRFIVFDAPPCVYVDDMGGTVWYPHLYASLTDDVKTKSPNAHVIDYGAKEIARKLA